MTMNQSFRPIWGTLEHKMAILAGNWAIGGTGAVGAKAGGHGLSLTRNSAGNYTVQLLDTEGTATGVPFILYAKASLFNSDANPAGDTDAHAVYEVSFSSSSGTFVFQCVDEAGVAADPPSGATVAVHLDVQLSALTA